MAHTEPSNDNPLDQQQYKTDNRTDFILTTQILIGIRYLRDHLQNPLKAFREAARSIGLHHTGLPPTPDQATPLIPCDDNAAIAVLIKMLIDKAETQHLATGPSSHKPA